MGYKLNVLNVLSALFGIAVVTIGLINTFWGNDMFFGIFLVLLALVYFPSVNDLIKKWFGFTMPTWFKILLGIFIVWAALGVGELFSKIALMGGDF